MNSIYIALQGTGNVGKSLIAILIAQQHHAGRMATANPPSPMQKSDLNARLL